MSPEGLKKNQGTILFLVALAVVLGVFCWKLQAALTEQKTVVAELDSERTRLTELQRPKRFFPSTANLETRCVPHNAPALANCFLAPSALPPLKLAQASSSNRTMRGSGIEAMSEERFSDSWVASLDEGA